jgi:tryptophan synthase alpha chain
MNPIDQLFATRKFNILSVFFTAGYPELNDTPGIIRLLSEQGADMIEIGMPFSDPMADGPVIRESNNQAIRNGMNLELLFQQLSAVKNVPIPKILMGYFNPVLQYGVENFCRDCAENGISGVILPDLPIDYFEVHYKSVFRKYGLHNILLVAPETPLDRIAFIDAKGDGFLYIVSTRGVTGIRTGFTADHERLQIVASLKLRLPLMMGFGISDKASFDDACRYARGGIIGTAFIKSLKEKGSLEEKVKRFVEGVRGGVE